MDVLCFYKQKFIYRGFAGIFEIFDFERFSLSTVWSMISMLRMSIYDPSTGEATGKKKSFSLKYLLYISIVLIITTISIVISVWGNFSEIVDAFKKADLPMIMIMVGLVILSYMIGALILFIFCRLYTRQYHYGQATAATLVGQFYSSVTPGGSGGQIMQAYTLKSQGIQISNAASIMVMWFITYQSVLIGFDIFALAFEFNTVISITAHIQFGDYAWDVPMWPLIMIGFIFNLFTILLMYAMSYSHRLHNFILHYVIGFLARIHLVRNADRTRENLRVQVENFKIELRRLQSNIPVVVLQSILILLMIFIRNSIPYFAGLSLNAWGKEAHFEIYQMFHAAFLSSFHQMVTRLIPLPGSAGVSELFYSLLFHDYFTSSVPTGMDLTTTIASTQILWRSVTFYFVLIITGIVAALYRSNGRPISVKSDHQTFVDLQLETFEERRLSSETMYETAQISRRALMSRLRRERGEEDSVEETPMRRKRIDKRQQRIDKTVAGKTKKKKQKPIEDDWDHLEL